MTTLIAIVATLIGMFFLYLVVLFGIGEIGGEVVILHRPNEDESISRRRLWIVDSDHRTWIEHHGAESFWVTALQQDPTVTLERNGEIVAYRGIPDPEAHSMYHALSREKFGWAHLVTGFLMRTSADKCANLPVRLERD